MGKINVLRVFLGGLAAGGISFAMQYVGFLLGVKLPGAEPTDASALALAVLELFVGGPLAIWLYAAVRPRFGAGPRTAIIVAVYIWLAMGPYGLAVLATTGLLAKLPLDVLVIAIIGYLPPIAVAILIGASLYKEEDAPAK